MKTLVSRMKQDWPALALLAVLLIVWEVIARAVNKASVPAVLTVLASIELNLPDIVSQVAHTLRRAAIAIGLALVTALPLGILIGRVRWLGELFEPLIDILRPLPPPTLAPLLMLFLGTGDAAKILLIYFTVSIVIVLHAIDGVRGTHPMLHTVSRMLRLNRAESLWLVDLPATLPVVITGLRLAVAAALLVSVTAEMLLSTNGIGVYLQRMQETFRIADGLAGICIIAVIGWAVNAALVQLDHRLLHWHYATTSAD